MRCPIIVGFLVFSICYVTLSEVNTDELPPIIGYLTDEDRAELKNSLLEHLKDAKDNGDSRYHVYLGLRSIGQSIPESDGACDAFKSFGTVTEAYTSLAGANLLKTCKVDAKGLEELSTSTLVDGVTGENLYKMVMARKYAGLTVDSPKMLSLIKKSIGMNANPFDMAYSLLLLGQFGFQKSELEEFEKYTTELIEYSFESPSIGLFYERGTFTTALVASALFEFSSAVGKQLPIGEDKLVKLINFLYLNRHSKNLRAASHILAAFRAIKSSSVYQTVVFINAQSELPPPGSRSTSLPFLANLKIESESDQLQLRLTNFFNSKSASFDKVALHLDDLVKVGQDASPSNKRNGAFKSSAKSTYAISLKSDQGELPKHGFYNAVVSAKSTGKTLLGATAGARIPLRITTRMQVSHASFALLDKENYHPDENNTLTAGVKYTSKQANGALPVSLGHQLSLSLRITNAKEELLWPHQVFLQLTHKTSQRRITFLFQAPATDAKVQSYSLRFTPKLSAVEMDFTSGIYNAELIVGDSLIVNPTIWHMFDLELDFSSLNQQSGDESRRRSTAINGDVSRQRLSTVAGQRFLTGDSSLLGSGPRQALPGIEHVFREAEKRAPRLVSLVFTALCLAPLPIMFLAWLILGVNMSYFRFSLSNLIFQAGLVGVFVLYLAYWAWFDMFTTLRYLTMIGIPTLIAGVSTLRTRLADRTAAATA